MPNNAFSQYQGLTDDNVSKDVGEWSLSDVIHTTTHWLMSLPFCFRASRWQVPGASNPTNPSWSNRYDPDEAEARVRNLIADTERMLAGLSGLSGANSQKPSEGVSV